MSSQEKKALLEAILFLENEPVEYAVLGKHLGMNRTQLADLVRELQNEYELRQSGLQIVEIAEGYQMRAHPRFSLLLSKIYNTKSKTKIPQSALEVLAVIAYKQPITKSEIEQVRGVSCERVIKQLLEKDLITISGRREGPGRPLEFGTTRNFLQVFGLSSIKDLPKLRELKELEFNPGESD